MEHARCNTAPHRCNTFEFVKEPAFPPGDESTSPCKTNEFVLRCSLLLRCNTAPMQHTAATPTRCCNTDALLQHRRTAATPTHSHPSSTLLSILLSFPFLFFFFITFITEENLAFAKGGFLKDKLKARQSRAKLVFSNYILVFALTYACTFVAKY